MAEVRLTHPDHPGEVRVVLPMPLLLVGETLSALGALGFVLPEAVGAETMTLGIRPSPPVRDREGG